jgi:AcrR family transcriptional regulator
MKRRRISTRRQRRTLIVPKPNRKGNIKVTREVWINCARVSLIEDGIGSLTIDSLAKRLKVTRGSFYYYFKHHRHLLEELLNAWCQQNRFTPVKVDASTPQSSARALAQITDDIVHENGFDPQFDMAVREWARISQPVADVVHDVDEQRTDVLRQVFAGLGYPKQQALIRARIFYWHQIGYYAVGVQEPTAIREANLQTYIDVLAGERYGAALKL